MGPLHTAAAAVERTNDVVEKHGIDPLFIGRRAADEAGPDFPGPVHVTITDLEGEEHAVRGSGKYPVARYQQRSCRFAERALPPILARRDFDREDAAVCKRCD
jgi:hypothetical protein